MTKHRCGGCGRNLPLEHRRPYYCSPKCHERRKELARAYARKYYAENPDKFRAKSTAHRRKDPAKAAAATKRWRESNPEVTRAYQEAWAAENKDKVVAGWRRWVAANPEKNRAKVHAWQLANPEKYKAQGRAKRARQRAAPGSHTAAEWRACVEKFGGCCFYCGAERPLTCDHLLALSRGGTDDIDNIVPACRRCNSSKKASDLYVWLDRMLREGFRLSEHARMLLARAA